MFIFHVQNHQFELIFSIRFHFNFNFYFCYKNLKKGTHPLKKLKIDTFERNNTKRNCAHLGICQKY